jgi:hypothetical protein
MCVTVIVAISVLTLCDFIHKEWHKVHCGMLIHTCRALAVPLPRRAVLIHTYHAAPLPFSDSAVSFVNVRVVD